MGSKYNRRLFLCYEGDNFPDRGRCKTACGGVVDLPCFKHMDILGDVSHFQYLGPAITEPAIANDQAFLFLRELARNRFHAKCTAAGNNDRRAGVVCLFDCSRYVLDNLLELFGHVVQGSIGVYDRKLKQSIGIYVVE